MYLFMKSMCEFLLIFQLNFNPSRSLKKKSMLHLNTLGLAFWFLFLLFKKK